MTEHARDTEGLERLEKTQPPFMHRSIQKTNAINPSQYITEVKP